MEFAKQHFFPSPEETNRRQVGKDQLLGFPNCSSSICISFSLSIPCFLQKPKGVVILPSESTFKKLASCWQLSLHYSHWKRLSSWRRGSREHSRTAGNRTAAAAFTWFPGWPCVICDDTREHRHSLQLSRTHWAPWQTHLPLEWVSVPEDLTDFLPTVLLVFYCWPCSRETRRCHWCHCPPLTELCFLWASPALLVPYPWTALCYKCLHLRQKILILL